MIIFDTASLLYVAQFLDSHRVHLNDNVYYDDGKAKRLVIDVDRIYEDFDVSGMFQRVLLGYRLIFSDAELKLSIHDSMIEFYEKKTTPFTEQELEDDLAAWIQAGVNDYMF